MAEYRSARGLGLSEQKNTIAKSSKKASTKKASIRVFVLVFLILIAIVGVYIVLTTDYSVDVQLKVDSVEIIQEEPIPAFNVTASSDGYVKKKLDKDTDYRVSDLIESLNNQEGFTIVCNTDGVSEGEYTIKVVLSEELQAKLAKEWLGKVRINVKNGFLLIKNKYGEWSGTQFLRHDGTNVIADWIVYKGDFYYFDDAGNMCIGWQNIGGVNYYFADNGKRQTGWLAQPEGKFYLIEDGSMYTGWLTLDEGRYYFGNDGKMYTGAVKVGTRDCVFDENGLLISESFSIDTNMPMIALTFDDGPGPRTRELIDVLASYGAHATFFMQGKAVPGYAATVQAMVEANCELGNHTFNHPSLNKLSPGDIQWQIGETNNLLTQAVGMPATVMRPPYGAVNDTVRTNVGLPMIMWSIDTRDWQTRNAQASIDHVMSRVKDGDIILMHDIHTESVDAAIMLIPMLIDAGYQLVTVSELAEARGVYMENGARYAEFYR